MVESHDPPDASAPADQSRSRIPVWVYFLSGGLVLALAISLGVAALVLRDKDKSAKDENLQVVEYQSPSDAGDDPFTTAADSEGSDVVRFKPASGTSDTSEPYGGSGSLHVCDREKLVDFLTSHRAQRRAWARVLGIDSDEDSVSRYVRSLTPVTITVDTRVTNHMYVDGRAVPFQSILAAGTAVLVDKYGRPVVRCKCGNPLLPPINYPKIRCKHCPPHYKPPKQCKWRIYDPWYPYPRDLLPPEWRDPYPSDYLQPKAWVYKKGKYCYIPYPDPPEIDYPPKWYPPTATYSPPPVRYYPPADQDDGDNYTTPPPDNDDGDGCHNCKHADPSDDSSPIEDNWDDMTHHPE
jgi:hypothetical protein